MKPRRPPLKRSAIKRKHRKPSETLRIYGGKKRIEWLQSQPCLVCKYVPSECAHIKTGGMGRKADARFTVPLCAPHSFQTETSRGWKLGHHRMLHQMGREHFEVEYGISLSTEASRVQKMWLALQEVPA